MPIPIVESQYTSMYYDEEKKLFEQFWYAESKLMTEEDYKQVHLSWVKKLIKHRYNIRRALLDNLHNFFEMSSELQQWHDQHIHQLVVQNLPDGLNLKVAIVASEDFLTQIGIEHTFLKNQQLNSNTYYFTDIREARDWIMKQQV
ncbi:hypothetical protein BKI52_01295 [marine bacterium AO1-C]|nr:hypothetical protein BKI52_01295 [marine bacterium AO1-C]